MYRSILYCIASVLLIFTSQTFSSSSVKSSTLKPVLNQPLAAKYARGYCIKRVRHCVKKRICTPRGYRGGGFHIGVRHNAYRCYTKPVCKWRCSKYKWYRR